MSSGLFAADRGLDPFLWFGEELVGLLADENRTRSLLRADFPRLNSESFSQRMKAVLTGHGKGRVNFPSILKRFIKKEFSDFSFERTWGDHLFFKKRITEGNSLLLAFEKIHQFGLGKTYKPLVGFEVGEAEKATSPLYPLLQFFDRYDMEWAYGSREDLEACLSETTILLRIILPRYEMMWSKFTKTGQGEILLDTPNYGSLSFKEAANLAFTLIGSKDAFSRINAAWLRPHITATHIRYPQVAAQLNGKLTEGQSWHVRFVDAEKHKTITVRIPYRGRPRFELSDATYINRNHVHHRMLANTTAEEILMLEAGRVGSSSVKSLPVIPFVDSPEIMRSAEDSGGAEFRHRYPGCAAHLSLNAEMSDPPLREEYWNIDYHFRSEQKLLRAAFKISAFDPNSVVKYGSGDTSAA